MRFLYIGLLCFAAQASAQDRELFDLEVDDGPSFVVLGPRSFVSLRGYLGDELELQSDDLPQPSPLAERIYDFNGQLGSKSSSFYSRTED